MVAEAGGVGAVGQGGGAAGQREPVPAQGKGCGEAVLPVLLVLLTY